MNPDVTALVESLLEQHQDPATRHFDAALAAAAAGGLDQGLERALRYWQRQSVANAQQFAATAVPAVLGVLRDAQAQTDEATERAGEIAQSFAAEVRSYPDVVVLPDVGDTAERPPVENLERRRRSVAARLNTI